MITVATIVGARPQFVKAAVVSRALRGRASEVLIHTGQHYDPNMSDVFFEEMGIPHPDHSLDVRSGSHGQQTGRMLERIEAVLVAHRPDWVLVYGDTNSTLAGALAAAKLHIPVAHVEAGLRSFNRRMPEEINRVLTDHASDLLLAPTTNAQRQLIHEGIPAERIVLTGDVMYDAALWYRERANDDVLARLGLERQGYVLATIHRAENTEEKRRFDVIVHALETIGANVPVVWPVHPRSRAHLPATVSPGVKLIDPVGYLEMIALERSARVIVTDSGGVQKEAFFFEVPCCTLRDETEWTELVELGWNTLVPPNHTDVVANAVLRAANKRGRPDRPYGDGNAAELIVGALLRAASTPR